VYRQAYRQNITFYGIFSSKTFLPVLAFVIIEKLAFAKTESLLHFSNVLKKKTARIL